MEVGEHLHYSKIWRLSSEAYYPQKTRKRNRRKTRERNCRKTRERNRRLLDQRKRRILKHMRISQGPNAKNL